MSRVYCSDAARLRRDDNAATAARTDVWILVELPITWGHSPLRDAALPPHVADALKRALRAIPRSRVVFIRKRVECMGCIRVYIAHSAPTVGVRVLDLPSINDVADVRFDEPVSAAFEPLVLVCTHGQHDSCCGRRGYPLYDALRQFGHLDLWQCSHIGGDRFAANAVILPWGLYYGPVEPRDAQALAESITREEILLPAYRGRSTMPKVAQAAETYVRRATGNLARDAYRLLAREEIDGQRTRVVLRDDHGIAHDVIVEQYLAAEDMLLTCSATTGNPIPQFRVIGYTPSADKSNRPPFTGGSQ